MRIIASIIPLAFVGFATPAASACRVAPEPVFVPIWEHAPTPDQVQPGEVALEVEFANSVKTSGSINPDMIVTGCQSFQDLVRIIRVIAGEEQDARFVVLPGSVWIPVVVTDTNDPPASHAPERMFVVGRLEPQREYFLLAHGGDGTGIPMIEPDSVFIARGIPVLQTRGAPR